MSFCRNSFQFKSTDLAERHSELMKRFGVSPTADNNMHLETSNSSMNPDQGCEQSSPRLQHRIPLCLADGLQMASPGNNAENVDSGQQKPKVRIIPIQIEGAMTQDSERQHTKSGGNVQNSQPAAEDKSGSTCSLPVSTKRSCDGQGKHISTQHETNQSNDVSQKPKVINIPVFVESHETKASTEPPKTNHGNVPVQKAGSQVRANIPASKPVSNGTYDMSHKLKNKAKVSSFIISMDKISAVLKELDSYKESVKNFSGVQGDKKYRYLDEMLTRCMLKLDNIETHGNEDIRKARKAAVKEIEKYVCMLDSKIRVPSSDEIPNSENEVTKSVNNGHVLVDQGEVVGELLDTVQQTDEEKSKEKVETDVQETVSDENVTSTIEDKDGEGKRIKSETEGEGMNQNSRVEQKSETAGHVTHSEERMVLSDESVKSPDCNAPIEKKVEINTENQGNVCNDIQEKMEVESVSEKNVEEPNKDEELKTVSEK